MKYTIGIDTGGTFTDVVIMDQSGRVYFDKAPTRPNSLEQGVLAAMKNCVELMGRGLREVLEDVESFSHGTTVGTNALIQKRGAKVGLIMTKGFEDTILITRGAVGKNLGVSRRQAMDYIHNERPDPLVPQSLIRGVSERVTADGTVLVPLNEEDVTKALNYLINQRVDAIAVCLLWSHRNDMHERRIKEMIRQIDSDLMVSISSEISPMTGEFERAMTVIENAYVEPAIVAYINKLKTSLSAQGMKCPVQIMKCSGGLTLPGRLDKESASVVNSGPAGGIVAARYLGDVLGYKNVITTDMGGTSFDVGLVYRGQYEYEKLPFFGQGMPAQVLSVKVVTVGAGGGSIAWTDGRRLLVGPRSAGADPGPACFGLGGTDATVTDALVVLGILNPDYFFGGRMSLSKATAEQVILDRIARPLKLELKEAAAGIYEVAIAMMGDLVRKVTVESGYDPRQFVLFSYGGAGPVGAALYGEALGVQEIIVPYSCACFSALGCAMSDVLYSYVYNDAGPVEATAEFVDRFNLAFREMEKQALDDMRDSGFSAEEVVLSRKLDLRYVGQLNDISVPWGEKQVTLQQVATIRHAFETNYELKFGSGTSRPESPLEITNFRLDSTKITRKPEIKHEPNMRPIAALRKGGREIYTRETGTIQADLFGYEDMAPGNFLGGPALIERRDTTIFVPMGHEAKMDEYRNIRIQLRR